MLKKEFKRKDVNRMRNLITGNSGASTGTQIGYKKKEKTYTEGDIWVENKKTWTIKNGIKQTISKLDKVKKEIHMPLCCPKCNKVMKSTLDKPNFRIHKKCLNCVIEHEHKAMIKLKLEGKGWNYENYIKELKINNNLSILDQVESYLLDIASTSNTGYISEHGEVERWVGGVDKKLIKEIKEGAQSTREHLKKEKKKLNE
tara:strand:- start:431 stop:1033 length:603 start_codon:yes stop_codon:yes gene_type:complete